MKIDSDFFSQKKAYIVQSSYAALSVFIVNLILSENPVVIASRVVTALGMTLIGCSNSAIIAIIISVLFLTMIAYLTKPYLEDFV